MVLTDVACVDRWSSGTRHKRHCTGCFMCSFSHLPLMSSMFGRDAEDAVKGRDGYMFDNNPIRVELSRGGMGGGGGRRYAMHMIQ